MDSGQLIPSGGPREPQGLYALEFNRPTLPSPYSAVPAQQDSVLREYLRVLIKRRWAVLSTLALIFSLVAIATLRATRIYEASGSIAINKTVPTLLNFKDEQNAGQDYYDPADLDTEVSILKSDMLALQVIKALNLDKLPEFGGSAPAPTDSLGLTTDELQPDSQRMTNLLDSFKGGLKVALRPNTRIIDVRYRSPDKDLAARVVNTVIHTYIEQNFKTRFESTMEASNWLSKQLVDLQMKVETSQEKLVTYQKEHEILGMDEKTNIITAKLDELNKELTSAESDTAAAAAINANGGSSATSSSSNLLEKLREQQADLNIQIAQLSTQFGPAYPKVAQLNSQLKEVNSQIQAEIKKVVFRVRSEYLAALQRENMLRDTFEKQKQEANKLNESAIEYSLLKRDVESYRTL